MGENQQAATEFALQIDQAWAAKDQDIDDLVHEISQQALRAIVQVSPVDTGRFRGNWITSVDTPDVSVFAEVRSPSQVIAAGEAAIMAKEKPNVIYIQNNLPYANRIENGWSREKAPQGVVGITVARIVATYEGKEV